MMNRPGAMGYGKDIINQTHKKTGQTERIQSKPYREIKEWK
jgi:hypothetical protein